MYCISLLIKSNNWIREFLLKFTEHKGFFNLYELFRILCLQLLFFNQQFLKF